MNNLQSPAYPVPEIGDGFSKLEKAALMMAGHLACAWGKESYGHEYEIARNARALAEAVLEEANK